MPRYYFDVRHGHQISVDDKGCDLTSLMEADEEASLSLAELALVAVGKHGAYHRMSNEVRDEHRPILRVRCLFEMERVEPEHSST